MTAETRVMVQLLDEVIAANEAGDTLTVRRRLAALLNEFPAVAARIRAEHPEWFTPEPGTRGITVVIVDDNGVAI